MEHLCVPELGAAMIRGDTGRDRASVCKGNARFSHWQTYLPSSSSACHALPIGGSPSVRTQVWKAKSNESGKEEKTKWFEIVTCLYITAGPGRPGYRV